MIEHAMRQKHGSRRAAAKLLGVSRPAIQSALRATTDSVLEMPTTTSGVPLIQPGPDKR
jgi:predicted transcriptional regulator